MNLQIWNTDDFDQMSWHDNSVHAFSIRSGPNGMGEIEFDIDYILKWLKPSENRFSFLLAPATLVFHDACDLIVSLNYSEISAATCPFIIHDITREPVAYPTGYKEYEWKIEINFPLGSISFRASGFTQTLRARPVESSMQLLSHEERGQAA